MNNGALRPARVKGGRVDIEHPCVAEYIARKGGDVAELDKIARRKDVARFNANVDPVGRDKGSPEINDDADLDELLHLTVGELFERVGSVGGFSDWLAARKLRAEVQRLELANAEKAGTLIPREPVKTHVFGLIDSTYRRLLSDAPKTIARRMYGLAKAGAPLEEAEREVREINSSLIKAIKATAKRQLDTGED